MIEGMFEVYSLVALNIHALAETISTTTGESKSDIEKRFAEIKLKHKEIIRDYIFSNFGHMPIDDILPTAL